MIRSVVIAGDGTAGRMAASHSDVGFGDRPGASGNGYGRAQVTAQVTASSVPTLAWSGWPSAPPPVGSAG